MSPPGTRWRRRPSCGPRTGAATSRRPGRRWPVTARRWSASRRREPRCLTTGKTCAGGGGGAGEGGFFQGLPARICWLGYGERDRAGLAFNDLVRSGEIRAPIVIGRDHLDAGSVASPYRETEAMADGSDALAAWPLLNAPLNTAPGDAAAAV